MMIVFVYDTSRSRQEEDDPADAVMYFHPAWVSPTQRLALAGQLMGAHHFLSTFFSPPKLISLQGGKFVLKIFGQYVLAVGTDRNIQDWVLERRANCLESILKFFHCDLDTISLSFNHDRNKFTEKLYQMLEIYLPILQYSANLFTNMPMIKLPSTASNVFLESMQVLQYCQELPGVLGGAMFYSNKVVATQLSADVTKQLVITDPYRIRAPADRITTDFHLPVGVQLLRVFIHRRQSLEVPEETNLKTNSEINDLMLKKYKKSCSVSTMKRDTSRIFTVPEEGEAIPVEIAKPIKRPPTLPINFVKRVEAKPKYSNPLTPSVCSTPLKDINRILHGNAVSICSGADELEQTDKCVKNDQENIDDIPDVVKEAMRCKRLNKLRIAATEKLRNKIRRSAWSRRSSSLTDLDDTKQLHDKFSLDLEFNSNAQNNRVSPRDDPINTKRIFHTITDPNYPVFRHDGCPLSQGLYDHFISCHYQELVKTNNNTFLHCTKLTNDVNNHAINDCTKNNVDDKNKIDGFDMLMAADLPDQVKTKPFDIKLTPKSRQEGYRRSMSLPLKSLNAPADCDDRRKSTAECGAAFELPQQRRKLEGLQLTPLMSKLSILASDEKTGGFCSKETTPSEFCELPTLSNRLGRNNKTETADRNSGAGDEDDENFWLNDKEVNRDGSLEKAELFICGQHNMVLVLLMENETANNADLIHNLVS